MCIFVNVYVYINICEWCFWNAEVKASAGISLVTLFTSVHVSLDVFVFYFSFCRRVTSPEIGYSAEVASNKCRWGRQGETAERPHCDKRDLLTATKETY